MTLRRTTAWSLAAAGAASFVGAHLVETAAWRSWFDPSGRYPPWFLNSGRAVAFAAVWLLAVGIVVGWLTARDPREAVGRGLAAAAGAVVAMAAILFIVGPGTIFPIVIAYGAVVVIGAVLAGAIAGSRFGRSRAGSSEAP